MLFNWYDKIKIAQEIPHIKTFDDRNRLNSRIRHLEKLIGKLEYASKLIYQTQRGARGIVKGILADKRLSSFPSIKNVLAKADDAAMDSPRRFAGYCMTGSEEIIKRIGLLKKERKRFVDEELGLPPKGLF